MQREIDLLTVLANWERENGTLAAIQPDEYASLCERLKRVAMVQGARAALDAARGESAGWRDTRFARPCQQGRKCFVTCPECVGLPFSSTAETPDEPPRLTLTERRDSPELTAALERARQWYETATPEEKAGMWEIQRQSWMRGEMCMGDTVLGVRPAEYPGAQTLWPRKGDQ